MALGVERGAHRRQPSDPRLLDVPQEPVADHSNAVADPLAVPASRLRRNGLEGQVELVHGVQERQPDVPALDLEDPLLLTLGATPIVILVLLEAAVGAQDLVQASRLGLQRLPELLQLGFEPVGAGFVGGLSSRLGLGLGRDGKVNDRPWVSVRKGKQETVRGDRQLCWAQFLGVASGCLGSSFDRTPRIPADLHTNRVNAVIEEPPLGRAHRPERERLI